ncbi:MAG: phage major capsid protein [Candidatus Atribacteria bacterium]|nr:phage major capsid protein [Candidatus Atribacteria bacterium]
MYTGSASSFKNTQLLTHTTEEYLPVLRHAAFNATPFLKFIAFKAWGKAAALGNANYGNVRKSSGKGIRFNDHGYQFSGAVSFTTASGSNVGRMAQITPQFMSPGKTWAYTWTRYVLPIGIPEEAVMDNKGNGRLINIMQTHLDIAQKSAIRDLSYMMLGHSSAPSSSPEGLNKLVSVTQTSIGGLDASSDTGWADQYVACTSVGGGGELDRPLALLRKMQAFNVYMGSFEESADDVVWACTTGAYQYYLRAAYADGVANSGLRSGMNDLYDAGIEAVAFNGKPVIYDGSIQVPTGATASTEAMYRLDLSNLGACIKDDQYFHLEGWEAPKTKDGQRFYQANLWLRWTPWVGGSRRIQGVLYNIPANPDTITASA